MYHKQFILLTFYPNDDYILTMDVNFIYKGLGRLLRDARKAAELTQETLAEQVGLNRTSITNIENGRQRIPFHLLFSLASAVGVHPAALLPERRRPHKPDIIDKEKLKTSLEQDQLDYVTTLVTSGIVRDEEQEDKKDESG